ncbi:signal peptidase II [Pelagibacteraceae bacterium]|nr:signal peptidase II [Pelagibacteraceae bacterium]
MNSFFILIFFVFCDLLTKSFVKKNFLLNESKQLNQFLDIVYVQNYGVSFGFLSGLVSYWILVIVGLIVTVLIYYLMIRSNKKVEKLAYFIIIIGALSNILDRIISSYVVDFISLHYNNFYWPAFNLADIYITIGIIMLIISFFIKSEEL